MSDTAENLDRILERLEASLEPRRRRDVIDEILGGASRKTDAVSLRDHPVVQEFRRELSAGLIRVDTANRLLGVIRMAVEAALV